MINKSKGVILTFQTIINIFFGIDMCIRNNATHTTKSVENAKM